MAEKKCWSKEDTFSLISLWESYPELWNTKSKIYRNRIRKQNALHELAANFNTNESEITRKLHNLRTQFHQELRRIQIKKDDGADDVYQTSWEYFSAMQFINCDHSDPLTVDNLFKNPTSRSRVKRHRSGEEITTKEFTKPCISTLSKSTTTFGEFDAVGTNVAAKLSKMCTTQQIYAEFLIQKILTLGALEKLTENTDVCNFVSENNFLSQKMTSNYGPTSPTPGSSFHS